MSTEIDPQEVTEYINIFKSLDVRQAITALLIFVIGVLIVKLLLKSFNKLLLKSKAIPPTLHGVLKTILRIVLYLIVCMTVANYIGIPITSFLTLLSVISLAVTLAVQGMLNNLVGSFIILVSKPLEVNDFVEIDGKSGTVKEIKTMYTRLETPDGRNLYIPNSHIYTANLINYNQIGRRRVEVDVSASYDCHPDLVRKAILEAVAETGNALENPAPVVWLTEYGDSAIKYRVMFWCTTQVFVTTRYDFTERLYDTFARNHVEMTYPHMNVHMKQ